jgi:hypothetical protein
MSLVQPALQKIRENDLSAHRKTKIQDGMKLPQFRQSALHCVKALTFFQICCIKTGGRSSSSNGNGQLQQSAETRV